MIRQIRGAVLSVEADGAVVDVAGWGVFVHLASPLPMKIGQEVSLYTYLAIRQDGPELYGFVDPEDRRFFELTLGVSGVGPKTALSLLRRAPREQLASAIAKRDLTYLTRVVGLGKKAAEKLMVELAEKLDGNGDAATDDADAEVFDTLVALGYTEREARQALAGIPTDAIGRDARLKAALSAAVR